MLRRFLNDESGATAIEYGLLAALIAIGILAGITAVGDNMATMFDDTAGTLKNAKPVAVKNGV